MKWPRPLVALAAISSSALFGAPPPQRVEIPNAAQPQLAVGADGRVWLAYGVLAEAPPAPVDHSSHAPGGKNKGHSPANRSGDVFVAASNDGGATFGPAVKVATLPKLMLGNRRGPRVAAHGSRLTVTAIADELVAFTSVDGGRTWGGRVTINEVPTSAREGLHDLAGAPNGEVFVTWLDLRNSTTELWGATSRDGGRTWSRNEPIYRSPDKSICECCHPTALFDAEGNLAVMWRNSIQGARDMWMTTRPKGASQFAAARKLGDGSWQLNACPMDGGRLVSLGAGKFGAVWQRNGEIFVTHADAAELMIGRGKQPVAASLDAGAPLIVWQHGPDLVSVRTLRGGEPSKHATDARFATLAALPGSQAILLAYERGPAKGPTTVVVERL